MNKQQTALGSPIERFTRMMFTRIIATLCRSLREQDFSLAQVAALHVLDQHGSMRVVALAEALALSPSAGSRLVDSLVQRGLVARMEALEDRRAKTLVLTPQGRAFVDRASLDRVRVIKEASQTLPSKLSAALFAAVSKFRLR